MNRPAFTLGVVITTYNSPLWLERVLTGYECQTDTDFETIIADDGSGEETRALIERFRARSRLRIRHVWHEDDGFRKTEILNKAIAQTEADYLIFTDGDCIPRADFIAVHRREARPNTFLSGGYLKLTMPVSLAITAEDIQAQHPFSRDWLVARGQPRNHKLWKLVESARMAAWLSRLTPTKATWNGMNSSTWRSDLLAVNGFDERMQYGGLDRELGERLWNHGLTSKQIRYQAICVHLDHKRGYAKPEIWERNYALRKEVRSTGRDWTPFGLAKGDKPE
ncbi:glycosyltransferase family 2 protein [Saccharospirillum salsuginis]|uniref:Glycosyl transferase n=1 Tax=Saccharospirillum salsuginis TaxID=418750 RepID=A0A918KNZ4_9GAMM|nr:glycosyltransferase family 2 protein [Saccharospirillum salsuginis]GGX70391.1 glycosyl transferase [Saccharospirillum salsuginis]